MSHSIDRYMADYFLSTARAVLDPLLSEHGFSYVGDHRGVTAYWRAGDQFIRIGYLPETAPRYELLIGVGEASGPLLEPKSSSNSIGVWRVLPAEIAPSVANWRFDSALSLDEELRRAWSDALVPYVLPLSTDPGQLAALIEEHADELTAEDEQLMHDRLVSHARAEFDAGRFASAVHAYDEIGEETLAPPDRKRLEIARKRR
jgi:hypothetical protein